VQFLFIISHDDTFRPTDDLIGEIGRWIGDARSRGVLLSGVPLRPPGEALTVRIRDGRLGVTSGPFSDSSEQMCAYELIECGDLEEAVDLAAAHPMAKAATIEVRPVWNELSEGA